jgi:hypothetical protein
VEHYYLPHWFEGHAPLQNSSVLFYGNLRLKETYIFQEFLRLWDLQIIYYVKLILRKKKIWQTSSMIFKLLVWFFGCHRWWVRALCVFVCVCERDVMVLVEGKATGWMHSQNKGPRMRWSQSLVPWIGNELHLWLHPLQNLHELKINLDHNGQECDGSHTYSLRVRQILHLYLDIFPLSF